MKIWGRIRFWAWYLSSEGPGSGSTLPGSESLNTRWDGSMLGWRVKTYLSRRTTAAVESGKILFIPEHWKDCERRSWIATATIEKRGFIIHISILTTSSSSYIKELSIQSRISLNFLSFVFFLFVNLFVTLSFNSCQSFGYSLSLL